MRLRLFSLALVASTVLAGASSGAWAAVVVNERVPFSGTPFTCGGEVVTVEGTTHVLIHQTSSEGTTNLFEFEVDHASGTSASGTRYVFTRAGISHENFRLDGNNGTAVVHFRMIAQGESEPADDLFITAVFHITVNANGEITSAFGRARFGCR